MHSRPHFHEMGGGDLDGDTYFLTWDKRLIPKRVADSMKYDTNEPKKVDNAVTVEEVISFFCKFICHGELGRIDDSHLAMSDLKIKDPSKPGAFHSEAIKLAEAHGEVIDFAKNGFNEEVLKGI